MITDSENDHYPVPADSSQRVIAIGEVVGDPVSIIDRSLWARLVKTGSDPVTVGVFGTTVTIQTTYE